MLGLLLTSLILVVALLLFARDVVRFASVKNDYRDPGGDSR